MRFTNPDSAALRETLGSIHSIAVVGLSPRPNRPSHQVARAMQGFGYRIIPVRPAVDMVLGERAYADLREVPEAIDLVNVFRNPAQLAPIIDACIELKLPRLWLQDGVINEAEARRAQAAGIQVVMNRCIYRDHLRLLGSA